MRTVEDRAWHEAAWFEAMYLDTVDDLRRFVARRVNCDSVDDAVSEIFLVAWRRQQDYRHSEARLWLFTVAQGVVANLLRADRRRALLQHRVGTEASMHPAEQALTSSVESEMLVALAALSESDQEVLRLVAWDGLTIAEAAMVCRCSHGTFRVRLFRARRRLAAQLSPTLLDQVNRPIKVEGSDARSQ